MSGTTEAPVRAKRGVALSGVTAGHQTGTPAWNVVDWDIRQS